MKTILLLLIIAFSLNAQALKISDLALYQRCHGHLTGEAVKLDDPVLTEIMNQRVSAIQACKDLLRTAQLSGDTPLPKSNKKGIKILETFFNVHADWFESKILDGDSSDSRAYYEASPGALYYSKALFDPNVQFSDIFRNTNSYEAIRSNGSPTVTPIGNHNVATLEYVTNGNNTAVWTGLVLPQVGDLEGIRTERPLVLNNFRGRAGATDVNGSFGGGLLGNRNYIMRTVKERALRSDGAVVMPRRWGRSVFVDFLCQDVPVVNISTDTGPFVDPTSETPFRTTAGCVSCHASMDQLSGLVRNYNVAQVLAGNNGRYRAPFFHIIDLPNVSYEWKADGDRDYFRQAAKGKFYYRTIDGQLMDRSVDNLNALGNLLAQVDDVYICAASRYVEHFTGVKYPMNKIASNANSTYSKTIRNLASELKATQDPMKVVESILSSDIYSDSKFKVGE